ncbi:MAG TPA: GNAT family N-acetyltransferase [Abditibacterium sp.]|jgi:RimJ/RimL family protein N-acetyltransferase
MNPITLDFPDHFETERLLIRAPRVGDGAILYRAICESLEAVRPWMAWAQAEPSIEKSEANMRRACADWVLRTDLRMLIFEKNGHLVGSSGLHRMDWDVPKFEIGYWGRTGYGGRGLMTEAVRGIASFAFEYLKAQRVEIECDARNQKSANVAQRAGFALEAHLKNHRRDHFDVLSDTLIFARVREEN